MQSTGLSSTLHSANDVVVGGVVVVVVYVDDVDDDEAGAGAYFLLTHSDAHINCELH